MMRKNGAAMAALAEAFPLTLPIFAGFWFIAFAYGLFNVAFGAYFTCSACTQNELMVRKVVHKHNL